MAKRPTKNGFTLIEVTFALAFLSVLLMTIAALTIHITSIYQKGLAIKAVTSTGRGLIDEFSRTVASSYDGDIESLCGSKYPSNANAAKDDCIADGARLFINQTYSKTLEINGSNRTVPIGGAFCTGRYSYLWNSGYVLKDTTQPRLTFVPWDQAHNGEPFRLLKIADANYWICEQKLSDNRYIIGSNDDSTLDDDAESDDADDVTESSIDYSFKLSTSDFEEVLAGSEDNLSLYRLDIFKPTNFAVSSRSFYSGTFILGTIQGGIDITSTGDYCTSPATVDLNTDFNYCAINKFNFAIRATGGTRQ
jgi:prepilin-type N-terminal cleavage/methylation domain-containing protein